MSSKSRRRMTMAVGATIAGAAIPLAAASSAWANTEITYDGIVLYDDFDLTHPFGSSDVGTLAESGTNNDWAIVSAPATETFANSGVLANDSATTDMSDVAYYQSVAAPTNFFGEQGASIVNATNELCWCLQRWQCRHRPGTDTVPWIPSAPSRPSPRTAALRVSQTTDWPRQSHHHE